MILIFTNSQDYDVKQVCEWLCYFNKDFIRLNNGQNYIDILSIDPYNNNFEFEINGSALKFSEIEAVWFRNGMVQLTEYFNYKVSRKNIVEFDDAIKYYLSGYSFSILEFLVNKLHSVKKCLGKHQQGRYNKLIALEFAKSVGLIIPETIVTSNKSELIQFYEKHNKIIIKSLDTNFEYYDSSLNARLYQYTNIVDDNYLDKLPDKFKLSLFQKYIKKDNELRVFYIDGQFYCTQIDSQLSSNTIIDYRRYDYKNMNRVAPYTLSFEVKTKIDLLMNTCELKTGSIDLINSSDNGLVFLEINPIGQYSYYGNMCGYNLNKVVAKYLAL